MYIENYLIQLQEMILDSIFQKKIKTSQYHSAVYLYWSLENFFVKLPDSYIRVDFKGNKKSLESDVLVLDRDGITFSTEGNIFSENGHDGYSTEYGQIIRGDSDHNNRDQYLQKFDGWFSDVSGILEEKKPYLDIEYYGEFKRDINFTPPIIIDESLDFYKFDEEDGEINEFVDSNGIWLYKYGNSNSLRFILGKKGENPLFVIGLNPSTADHTKLDPTANSINRIATNNGFDSWVILNLFPLRATDPYALPTSIDLAKHEQNLNSIRHIFQRNRNPTIWAAWGNLIEVRPYLIECLRDIHRVASEFDSTWYSFGKITKKGHPRHPLYLNSETVPNQFNIEEYLSG